MLPHQGPRDKMPLKASTDPTGGGPAQEASSEGAQLTWLFTSDSLPFSHMKG